MNAKINFLLVKDTRAFYEQSLVVPHTAVDVGVVRRDVDDHEGPEVLVSRLAQGLPRAIQIN